MIGVGNDCLFPLYVPIEGHHDFLRVRCGHCINCKLHRASEWSMRLEMESNYWKDICFVTLTYDDDNLPLNIVDPHLFYEDKEIEEHPELNYLVVPTLRPDHLRNFIKRVRKHIDHKIKFYAVGEYGTKFQRSHLHVMFFGLGYNSATEQLIRDCWPFGFSKVTPFFTETCRYVARYVQKKLYGKDKYMFKLPEFMRCSQHLGEKWLDDHIDSFDDEHPFISWHGYEYGIPRQFRKILVKKGKLKETSLLQAALVQKSEYAKLARHVEMQHKTMSDYFKGRITNAVENERRVLLKRKKTGDI